jgi:hypothetical protein
MMKSGFIDPCLSSEKKEVRALWTIEFNLVWIEMSDKVAMPLQYREVNCCRSERLAHIASRKYLRMLLETREGRCR